MLRFPMPMHPERGLHPTSPPCLSWLHLLITSPCITLGDTQQSWRKLRCALVGIIPVGASVSPCEGKGGSPLDPLPITWGPFAAAPAPAAHLPPWHGSAAPLPQRLPQGLGLDSVISASWALLSQRLVLPRDYRQVKCRPGITRERPGCPSTADAFYPTRHKHSCLGFAPAAGIYQHGGQWLQSASSP